MENLPPSMFFEAGRKFTAGLVDTAINVRKSGKDTISGVATGSQFAVAIDKRRGEFCLLVGEGEP